MGSGCTHVLRGVAIGLTLKVQQMHMVRNNEGLPPSVGRGQLASGG